LKFDNRMFFRKKEKRIRIFMLQILLRLFNNAAFIRVKIFLTVARQVFCFLSVCYILYVIYLYHIIYLFN